MENDKFWHELKVLVVFLSSGAFMAVHKRFMDPKELFPEGHWRIEFHNCVHSVIGLLLQILFFVCIVRIVWNVLIRPILLKFQWFRSLQSKNISQDREQNDSQ